MRITIVTGPFFSIPPAPCGAVERVWTDLAQEFARRGHRVTILCRSSPALRSSPHRGVRILPLSRWTSTSSIWLNLAKDSLYAAHAATHLPRADILVTNTFWLPVLARLWPSAGRIVVSVERMPKGQMPLYAGAGVHRFAAVSHAVARAIAKESAAAHLRTRVIPNPMNADAFVPPREPRAWDGPLTIAYAGRIHPEKGVHLLLHALRLLNRPYDVARVLLIGAWRTEDGGGGREYRTRLERLARGLPVEFVEPIYDRSDFAARLQSAHVFCYPSLAERGEAFGVAPLEAMATGAIPVVSNLDCFQDFVTAGENGLTFDHRGKGRAARLAAALDSLLADRELCHRLSVCAASDAQRFSLPKVADTYLEDFEELLHS